MTEQELMLTAILECERTDLYIKKPQLTSAQKQRLQDMQERRASHEPLQYILGQTHFFGLPFYVNPSVLIPRPETELLVENLLNDISHNNGEYLRILEVGTGSGNIAIALAKSLLNARVTALDISKEALSVACANASLNDVVDQIDFVCCDFFEFSKNFRQAQNRFDIIVSNPPYIATPLLDALPKDVKREPVLALNGGDDGLKFYRGLITCAKRFLKDKGVLTCEIGDGQKDGVSALLVENGFVDFYFNRDYHNSPRYFLARG